MDFYEVLYGCAPRRANYCTPDEQRDMDWREDDDWQRDMRALNAEVATLGNAIDEATK